MSNVKIDSLHDIPSVASYFRRIGARARSFKTAIVEEEQGRYWVDKVIIRFDKNGFVDCSDESYAPTEDELKEIEKEWDAYQFPQSVPAANMSGLPENVKSGTIGETLFPYRDKDGSIVMVQHRVNTETKEDGLKKVYLAWTYFDDGKWRQQEPDQWLPIYNAHKIGPETKVIILHEGAKGAHQCQSAVEGKSDFLKNHPWKDQLIIPGVVHCGWQGGALNPHRTSWGVIKNSGVDRVIIISDNDREGKAVAAPISRRIAKKCFQFQPNSKFPPSWDLADPLPKEFFDEIDGESFYNGPMFDDLMVPATWATDLRANPRGKPTPVLRSVFGELWKWCEEPDIYVNIDFPRMKYSEKQFNKHTSGFSDVNETSKLLHATYSGQQHKLAYSPPDGNKRFIDTDEGVPAINLYRPSRIVGQKGSIDPFIEYLQYMVEIAEEAHEVARFIATLVGCPWIKMNYALILISETQGIGKTIFASKIAAPLVGIHNTGFPTEDQITKTEFNDWFANKRLVVCNEIHSGNSWKAYHTLKSVITDQDVTVNEKFVKAYKVENWAHVIACSNTTEALKMEESDRRWLYPRLTETPWPGHKFKELVQWLERGGLKIIKHWAEKEFPNWEVEFCNQHDLKPKGYVRPQEIAPMTMSKKSMINASRTDAQKELIDLCQGLDETREEVALAIKDVKAWLRGRVEGRIYDSDHDLKKAVKAFGWRTFGKRVRVNRQMQSVIVSPAAWKTGWANEEEISPDDIARIKSLVKRPGDLAYDDM